MGLQVYKIRDKMFQNLFVIVMSCVKDVKF